MPIKVVLNGSETALSGFRARTRHEVRAIIAGMRLVMLTDPTFSKSEHCWRVYCASPGRLNP